MQQAGCVSVLSALVNSRPSALPHSHLPLPVVLHINKHPPKHESKLTHWEEVNMNNRQRYPDECDVYTHTHTCTCVFRLSLQTHSGRDGFRPFLGGMHCCGVRASEFQCVFKEIDGGWLSMGGELIIASTLSQ